MDSRGKKRKASTSKDDEKTDVHRKKPNVDLKDMVQDKVMTLLTNSMDFHNNIESAEDDFIRMFNFMKDRQFALFGKSIGLHEEYR